MIFKRELEYIDAILERTNKIIENLETLEIKPNRLKQLLKPKNQDEIWEKWQEVINSTRHEPPILRSAILLDAWINLDPIRTNRSLALNMQKLLFVWI